MKPITIDAAERRTVDFFAQKAEISQIFESTNFKKLLSTLV